jgi:2-polyprenyl-6-methoxyphenol hydroxylase-like FAD-dependent oxidoreductase
MTRNQEVHDTMRIVHRDQAITLANNVFHRMARIDLLKTLRKHCADLGVAIEFGRRVDTLDEFADCDLIVAADGAASTIRTRYRDHFEPTIDVRPNLLAWYGTTCLFDPLTLIFRENDDGLLIPTYRYSHKRAGL